MYVYVLTYIASVGKRNILKLHLMYILTFYEFLLCLGIKP